MRGRTPSTAKGSGRCQADRRRKWPQAANAPGTKGGRPYRNGDEHLPTTDGSGKPITYEEWDVDPKVPGQDRGNEGIVTVTDRRGCPRSLPGISTPAMRPNTMMNLNEFLLRATNRGPCVGVRAETPPLATVPAGFDFESSTGRRSRRSMRCTTSSLKPGTFRRGSRDTAVRARLMIGCVTSTT